MRVYLIAAPEDEAEAEKLAAYLKRFGVFIRSEYGKYSYPPARHGEYTLALWSRNAMMSSRQMMLTNRAIDAWEHDQLIMARLEHGLSPRGLSDLKMVDLTFEAAREHRYRDVLTALRAVEDASRAAAPPPPPQASAPPDPTDDGGVDEVVNASPEPPTKPSKAARKSIWVWGVLLLIVLAINALIWLLASLGSGMGNILTPGAVEEFNTRMMVWIGGGAALFLVLLLSFVFRFRRKGKARAEPKRPSRRLRATSDLSAVPESEMGASRDSDVFVSYSHANAETVLPIVKTVEERGVSIWIDRDEMRAGQGWAGQIVRAIKTSERFCLMCSEQAFASDHVRREVYLADKYGKDMVPIRLDGAEMPEDIEYFLIGKQWVDLNALQDDERLEALEAALSGAVS